MKYKFLLCLILFLTLSNKAFAAYHDNSRDPVEGQNDPLVLRLPFGTSRASTYQFGKTGTFTQKMAIKFRPTRSFWACNLDLDLSKMGSPTDDVHVLLYTGGDTDPSGATLLSTSNDIIGSSLDPYSGGSGTYDKVTFFFGTISSYPGNCVAMSKDNLYWYVIERTGSENDTNFYVLGNGPTTDSTGMSNSWAYSYGSWVNQTGYGGMFRLFGIDNSANIGEGTTTDVICTESWYQFACNLVNKLFIPPGGTGAFMQDKINEAQDLLYSQVPFVYLTGNISKLTDFTPEDDSGYLVDTYIPINTPTLESEAIHFQAFDTSYGSPEKNVFDIFRPWIQIFLWLFFGYYVITRVFRLFKPL